MNTEPIFPNDLWPVILSHFTLWQRYQYITVCKAWANGLIAQSVTALRCEDFDKLEKVTHLPLSMSSLTYLEPDSTETFKTFLDKPHLLHKLQHLDMIYRWPIASSDTYRRLDNLRSLRLVDFEAMDYESLFSGLSSLTTLRLSSNCECTLPNETLSLLSSLTDLALCDTTLITDATLASFTRLRRLKLKDNDRINGSALSSLTNLRSLSLQGNKITVDMIPQSMTALTSLNINGNSIKSIDDLTHLTRLVSLSLSDSVDFFSTDLTYFPNLTRLIMCKNVYTNNGIQDCLLPETLSRMSKLRELRFESSSIAIDDECLVHLTNLTSLHIMQDCDIITTASIARLTALVALTIEDSGCSKINIALLPTSLRKLSFKNSNRWTRGIHTLSLRLTNLSELWLGRLPSVNASQWWTENLGSLSSLDLLYYKLDLCENINTRVISPGTVARWTEVRTY